MSTTLQTRSNAAAMRDAMDFRNLFTECFERWTLAGSLRRKKPQVGDVEHLVMHRLGEVPDGTPGLFTKTKTVSLVWHKLDQLVADKTVTKHIYSNGTKYGDRLRAVDFRGFCHELYSADEHNWGKQLAIRTGPAEFSHRLVIELQKNGYWDDQGYTWSKRDISCPCGWRGTWSQLSSAKNERAKYTDGNGNSKTCPNCGDGMGLVLPRVSVPDEQTYFKLCGLRYLEPEDRR